MEEAHDHLTTFIIDVEGEFANLAEHIGASTIRASEIADDGITVLPLHLDLTDLEPDVRIQEAAAFFAGLLVSPKEDWANTVLVAMDELRLAPRMAASARDAETRRVVITTLTDLCGRGRKRGIAR